MDTSKLTEQVKRFCDRLELSKVLVFDPPRRTAGKYDLVIVLEGLSTAKSPVNTLIDFAGRCSYMHYSEGTEGDYPINYERAFRTCWRPLGGDFYQSRVLLPHVGILPTLAQMAGERVELGDRLRRYISICRSRGSFLMIQTRTLYIVMRRSYILRGKCIRTMESTRGAVRTR